MIYQPLVLRKQEGSIGIYIVVLKNMILEAFGPSKSQFTVMEY